MVDIKDIGKKSTIVGTRNSMSFSLIALGKPTIPKSPMTLMYTIISKNLVALFHLAKGLWSKSRLANSWKKSYNV